MRAISAKRRLVRDRLLQKVRAVDLRSCGSRTLSVKTHSWLGPIEDCGLEPSGDRSRARTRHRFANRSKHRRGLRRPSQRQKENGPNRLRAAQNTPGQQDRADPNEELRRPSELRNAMREKLPKSRLVYGWTAHLTPASRRPTQNCEIELRELREYCAAAGRTPANTWLQVGAAQRPAASRSTTSRGVPASTAPHRSGDCGAPQRHCT